MAQIGTGYLSTEPELYSFELFVHQIDVLNFARIGSRPNVSFRLFDFPLTPLPPPFAGSAKDQGSGIVTGPESTKISYSAGKSCSFALPADAVAQRILSLPVYILALEEQQNGSGQRLIGSVALRLGSESDVKLGKHKRVIFYKGKRNMVDVLGNVVGNIDLDIKLTCLGKSLLPHMMAQSQRKNIEPAAPLSDVQNSPAAVGAEEIKQVKTTPRSEVQPLVSNNTSQKRSEKKDEVKILSPVEQDLPPVLYFANVKQPEVKTAPKPSAEDNKENVEAVVVEPKQEEAVADPIEPALSEKKSSRRSSKEKRRSRSKNESMDSMNSSASSSSSSSIVSDASSGKKKHEPLNRENLLDVLIEELLIYRQFKTKSSASRRDNNDPLTALLAATIASGVASAPPPAPLFAQAQPADGRVSDFGAEKSFLNPSASIQSRPSSSSFVTYSHQKQKSPVVPVVSYNGKPRAFSPSASVSSSVSSSPSSASTSPTAQRLLRTFASVQSVSSSSSSSSSSLVIPTEPSRSSQPQLTPLSKQPAPIAAQKDDSILQASSSAASSFDISSRKAELDKMIAAALNDSSASSHVDDDSDSIYSDRSSSSSTSGHGNGNVSPAGAQGPKRFERGDISIQTPSPVSLPRLEISESPAYSNSFLNSNNMSARYVPKEKPGQQPQQPQPAAVAPAPAKQPTAVAVPASAPVRDSSPISEDNVSSYSDDFEQDVEDISSDKGGSEASSGGSDFSEDIPLPMDHSYSSTPRNNRPSLDFASSSVSASQNVANSLVNPLVSPMARNNFARLPARLHESADFGSTVNYEGTLLEKTGTYGGGRGDIGARMAEAARRAEEKRSSESLSSLGYSSKSGSIASGQDSLGVSSFDVDEVDDDGPVGGWRSTKQASSSFDSDSSIQEEDIYSFSSPHRY